MARYTVRVDLHNMDYDDFEHVLYYRVDDLLDVPVNRSILV